MRRNRWPRRPVEFLKMPFGGARCLSNLTVRSLRHADDGVEFEIDVNQRVVNSKRVGCRRMISEQTDFRTGILASRHVPPDLA